MPTLIVADLDGQEKAVSGALGSTLMEVIRDSGFDDLLAICGGACSCATCHVVIQDPARFAALPAMGETEDALLDGSDHRRPTSRLSCQIKLTDALDGLRLAIAPAG